MDQEAAQRFGAYIKELREKQQLSIRQAAARSGVYAGTLARLEHGEVCNPLPSTLKCLAATLQVPLSDVFAMATYVVPYDLPSLSPYLRARYGHLSEDTLAAADQYLQRLIEEQEMNPNGPDPFEDEASEPLNH
jgi:transcriptional regulator with XRE-family HTH domain